MTKSESIALRSKGKKVSPGKKIELELVRSYIGCPEWMRVIARTLSLRRLRDKAIMPDNGAIRGMVAKIPHLVTIKEVEA